MTSMEIEGVEALKVQVADMKERLTRVEQKVDSNMDETRTMIKESSREERDSINSLRKTVEDMDSKHTKLLMKIDEKHTNANSKLNSKIATFTGGIAVVATLLTNWASKFFGPHQ